VSPKGHPISVPSVPWHPCIHPSAVIYDHVEVGDNVTIGAGCVIGGPGFGYEWDDDLYLWVKKPETHGVVIEDDVHIGANTCIDRGSYRDTVIGAGTRIDNLVHVAHNVQVGRNCLVIAQAELSGSVVVEDNCWIGPRACVREHLTIGHDSLVGIGSVVVKDVEPHTTVMGVPAKPKETRE
jgi:UDP-3-O-[3-hydroxymyristoyl] glucosamine N-acyltransferase